MSFPDLRLLLRLKYFHFQIYSLLTATAKKPYNLHGRFQSLLAPLGTSNIAVSVTLKTTFKILEPSDLIKKLLHFVIKYIFLLSFKRLFQFDQMCIQQWNAVQKITY